MTAGKKETVTKGKEKVQKRFLLDTMKNLYKSFKQEFPEEKCSYYYFTKNRPWYVVTPSVSAREMCQCKTHANPIMKAMALKKKGVLETDNLNLLISATVCDSSQKECMYGICEKCRHHNIPFNKEMVKDKVVYSEWNRKEEKYLKDGKEIKAVKNVKEDKEVDTQELVIRFKKELCLLKKHIYNMKTQHKKFRECIDNIQSDEAIILVDFSENYSCKYSEEIQAHHFGGSRQQLTLHTVMLYVRDKENKIQILPFCTVSSIWANLHPILSFVRENYPQVNTLHFFSDGPLTQYRQKQNFFLVSTKPFDYGFIAVSWSFFEAGHGKGPADGIGGYLKRTADTKVAKGHDIANLQQFFDAVKDMSKIKLQIVTKEEIDRISEWLPVNLLRLQGTLQVHQIFTTSYAKLMYRSLSCFCEKADRRGFCECLNPKLHNTIKPCTENQQVALTEHTNKSVSFDEEDDLPLTRFMEQKENQDRPEENIDYLDLSQSHNKFYKYVYSDEESDDENREPQPSCSNTKNILPCRGDFLLVKVEAQMKSYYKYVCVAQSDMEDDGEIKVMFLKAVKGASKFRPDPRDISYVAFDDIIQKLKKPKMINTKSRISYEFQNDIDIFEK